MKTRLYKFLLALSLLPLFASAFSVALGQDQTSQFPNQEIRRLRGFGGMGYNTNVARFDVEIEDGQLSLAPLKGRIDPNELWGENAQPADVKSVKATISNLAKYLRAADTNANITVAPSAAEIQIKDLKLRGADVSEVVGAVGVATDGAVSGSSFGHDFSFSANQVNLQQNADRTVEVFNVSGFIQHLGATPDSHVVRAKLDELQKSVLETLTELHGSAKNTDIEFKFHPGTELLVVIGKPDAIDVARKFISALPAQSPGTRQDPLDNHAPPQQN